MTEAWFGLLGTALGIFGSLALQRARSKDEARRMLATFDHERAIQRDKDLRAAYTMLMRRSAVKWGPAMVVVAP